MTAIERKVKHWRKNVWGEMLSEFFGTFVLILFGDGVVGLVVAGMYGSGRADEIFAAGGDWMIIGWGWGLAVAFGVYVAGGVSGAHLNPAVTLGHAFKGLVEWKKVIPYWIAQTVGAFLGALVVYIEYYQSIDMLNEANGVTRASEGGLDTFSIFATFPAEAAGGTWGVPLFDQILGTFLLVFLIYALIDNKNVGFGGLAKISPFVVGLIVVAVGISFGTNAGYAINPARDFGPRLFAWFAGWGPNAFPGPGNYWWIPIIGPLIGGAIAPFAYVWIIEKTLSAQTEEESTTVEDDS
ncbi:MAG TPA: MIP/aquaporin family protein [Pseudogracilibacillus sp.]|nr:MIP/aquaporin family protein [Pseudogracilibacillus sp.]